MSGRVVFDRRSRWLAKLASVALLAILVGLAYRALPVPEAGRNPPNPLSDDVASPAIGIWFSAPAPLSDTAPESHEARPVVAADTAPYRPISRPVDMPYRFAGRSAAATETSIVLFGRGRVVTVRGPGPLDDEYVVEAVSDDYVLIRHVPSSVGTFMALTQRRGGDQPPRDPEESPRD